MTVAEVNQLSLEAAYGWLSFVQNQLVSKHKELVLVQKELDELRQEEERANEVLTLAKRKCNAEDEGNSNFKTKVNNNRKGHNCARSANVATKDQVPHHRHFYSSSDDSIDSDDDSSTCTPTCFAQPKTKCDVGCIDNTHRSREEKSNNGRDCKREADVALEDDLVDQHHNLVSNDSKASVDTTSTLTSVCFNHTPSPTPCKRRKVTPLPSRELWRPTPQNNCNDADTDKTWSGKDVDTALENLPSSSSSSSPACNKEITQSHSDAKQETNKNDNAHIPEWVNEMKEWMITQPHGPHKRTISSYNVGRVMSQVKKLVSGKGIRFRSWKQGVAFCPYKVDLVTTDFGELFKEAQKFENEHGKDKSYWALRHPIKKMELFQAMKRRQWKEQGLSVI